MPRQHRPGQIGDYWLSTNRHGTWCRTWFDPQTRQTRRAALGAADFDSAVIALAEWVVLHQELRKEDPAAVPVPAVLRRYYDRHGKKLPSAEMTELAVTKLEQLCANDTVADLTLDRQHDIEETLRQSGLNTARGRKLSDGYIARIQTVLKASLNAAHEAGELAHVPFVRILSSTKERDRLLSLKEAAALFNADPPEHTFIFLMLAFNTLSRPEALLEAQPFQVDLEHRLLHLNPAGRVQTKKRRPTVPITDVLLPWLQGVMTQRYLIQWHEEQTAPIASIKTTWRRLRKAAGLPLEVVPYTIRHTMATELRRRGVPQWDVSGMLGHGTAGTTERYAKFSPDYLSTAAAAICDYFNELQPLVRRELIVTAPPAPKPERRHLKLVK